ncbi:activator of Hsp90 ATPase [Cokeromyces recurvatus]|uniref:activator of Hsp90 ATPase n=1 Tax=Cokeromyces recurvatus TaxID=90255 RepID=UPI002220F572|nr:activator of Hsp90 ATPase [Cokeromyces recurvatus]KAI7900916.1 activator of Hsp90 ATPase [Cokeromyces recurvatus]
MSNWKNVNNWHWVNKNCLKWAQKWFTEQLVGLEAEKDGNKASISKMVDCSGDVDLNQRKGKIITIYDVALRLNWKGTLADDTEVTGSIEIPEIAHDTDADDFVFNISIFDESNEKQVMKEVIRKGLVPLIKQKFEAFSPAMIKENCDDVYIESSQMGVPTPPRMASPTVKANANTTAHTTSTPATTAKVLNTTSINDQEEFQTSAHELYLTLTDAQRASIWSRGHVKLEPKVGAKFELFNGNVTGEILELEPDKKIVKNWRLRSWPQGHYSKVTLEFVQGSESVLLKINQTGIPIGEEELTMKNWNGYYWKAIKSAFGYGVNF